MAVKRPKISSQAEPILTRKCNRFQFECRSTGECIAIYNACDGILQCADGSDEAVELGCPESLTTALPTQPAHTNSQPGPVRYDTNLQPPPQPLHPNSNAPQLYSPPQLSRDPQLPPLLPHNSEDFLRPVSDPRLYDPQSIYHEPPPIYHNNPLQPYAQTQQQQIQAGWGQPQIGVGQPIPQYADKNSHIFTHKESGYQVPDGQEMSQMQYSETLGGRNYPKMNGYYDVNYRQPVQQENWPLDEGAYETQQKFLPPENAQDHNRNKPAQEYVPQPQSPNVKPETPANQQVDPPHIQEKLAHDLKHSKESMEHGSVQQQKIKIEQHHHEQYPDVVAYRIVDNDLQDGIAQTPRGAVLSVTLGLIITAIMAVMIGCRLKMVRRRLRKGGKTYAHDADFLVNGMYL